MFHRHVRVALRQLWRNKAFSIINMFGLATGLSASILILLWILDELAYDGFHERKDRIYRVVENQAYPSGEVFQTPQTPPPLAEALVREFPDIMEATRVGFMYEDVLMERDGIRFYEEDLIFADPSFFSMFTFPLVEGDAAGVLDNPASVVVSETMARKYFGSQPAVGSVLRMSNQHDLLVTGVMKDVPSNSHLKFDFVIPFEFQRTQRDFSEWGTNWHRTYVMTRPAVLGTALDEKIRDIIKRHSEESITEIFLQPLGDVYLRSALNQATPRITMIYVLGVIAALVLAIACINFMNLSTARAARRAREVGLRKVVGADRSSLVRQFMGESILVAVLSAMIAVVLIEAVLPAFNALTEKELELHWTDVSTMSWLGGLVLVTGIFAGLYPAVFLSRYRPAEVLKGQVTSGREGARFRQSLVIAQFTLSVILMISSVVVYTQLQYVRHMNLGFDRENVLLVPLRGSTGMQFAAWKSEVSRLPQVAAVTAGWNSPTGFGTSTWGVEWPGKQQDERILTTVCGVEADFVTTYGIALQEGRDFRYGTDSLGILVNETAARSMNLRPAVGSVLKFWDKNYTVIGLLRDFHVGSIHDKIPPTILLQAEAANNYKWAAVRFKAGQLASGLSEVESQWKRSNPQYPFEFRFLDDELDRLYRSEQRLSGIVGSFTVLAVLISCLGLFGLSSFATEQRFKEIGIRKVLGASIVSVVFLLSREFVVLVLAANMLAVPVAYWAADRWLQDFAYRTDVPWSVFVLMVPATLLIAVGTVGFQAVRAAAQNPVTSLRYE